MNIALPFMTAYDPRLDHGSALAHVLDIGTHCEEARRIAPSVVGYQRRRAPNFDNLRPFRGRWREG